MQVLGSWCASVARSGALWGAVGPVSGSVGRALVPKIAKMLEASFDFQKAPIAGFRKASPGGPR